MKPSSRPNSSQVAHPKEPSKGTSQRSQPKEPAKGTSQRSEPALCQPGMLILPFLTVRMARCDHNVNLPSDSLAHTVIHPNPLNIELVFKTPHPLLRNRCSNLTAPELKNYSFFQCFPMCINCVKFKAAACLFICRVNGSRFFFAAV